MATTLSRGKPRSISLGPNELLNLSLILDRNLLAEFQATVGKLGLSVEEVTLELIRLFVRQSPLADARRGIPLVGFLNLGRVDSHVLSSPKPEEKLLPQVKNSRKPIRNSLPTPAEIAEMCVTIRSEREEVTL